VRGLVDNGKRDEAVRLALGYKRRGRRTFNRFDAALDKKLRSIARSSNQR